MRDLCFPGRLATRGASLSGVAACCGAVGFYETGGMESTAERAMSSCRTF